METRERTDLKSEVSMSESIEKKYFEEERKNLIVEYINKNAKATVPELCTEFSVSSATIRNDLRALANKGLINRTHGGAISNQNVSFEQENREKSVRRVEAKEAIAQLAAEYIREGDSICLDAGTTMYKLAQRLTAFRELTVVTYDIGIANFLENHTSNRVIIAGGMIRKKFNYTVGEMALAVLERLNVDTFFLTANGVCLQKGLSTPDIETSRLKRTMISNSNTTILLADSSKVDAVSFARFAGFEDLDVVITDQDVAPAFVKGLERQEILVKLAKYRGSRQ
ncbi:MAG: DeoR/GlpR family DNA-binding transcription regulator [Blautia sp.]|jgi:DeoR family fructose operon transcriptional repressor